MVVHQTIYKLNPQHGKLFLWYYYYYYYITFSFFVSAIMKISLFNKRASHHFKNMLYYVRTPHRRERAIKWVYTIQYKYKMNEYKSTQAIYIQKPHTCYMALTLRYIVCKVGKVDINVCEATNWQKAIYLYKYTAKARSCYYFTHARIKRYSLNERRVQIILAYVGKFTANKSYRHIERSTVTNNLRLCFVWINVKRFIACVCVCVLDTVG